MDYASWKVICTAGGHNKKFVLRDQFGVSERNIDDLCESISRSWLLDSLTIRNCGLTDIDLQEIIFRCVERHPSLTKIDFSDNIMTTERSELELLKAISKNPRIHTISISSRMGKSYAKKKAPFSWFGFRKKESAAMSLSDAMLELLVANDTVVYLGQSLGFSSNALDERCPRNILGYNMQSSSYAVHAGEETHATANRIIIINLLDAGLSSFMLGCTAVDAEEIKLRIPSILAVAEETASRPFVISQYLEAARSRPQTFSASDIEKFMTSFDRVHVSVSVSPVRSHKFKLITGGASALKR